MVNRLLAGNVSEDASYPLGQAGDLPFVGDWTRGGYSALGVFRPSTATFFLKNNLDGSAFDASVIYLPDEPGVVFRNGFETAAAAVSADLPLAGNWGSVPE